MFTIDGKFLKGNFLENFRNNNKNVKIKSGNKKLLEEPSMYIGYDNFSHSFLNNIFHSKIIEKFDSTSANSTDTTQVDNRTISEIEADIQKLEDDLSNVSTEFNNAVDLLDNMDSVIKITRINLNTMKINVDNLMTAEKEAIETYEKEFINTRQSLLNSESEINNLDEKLDELKEMESISPESATPSRYEVMDARDSVIKTYETATSAYSKIATLAMNAKNAISELSNKLNEYETLKTNLQISIENRDVQIINIENKKIIIDSLNQNLDSDRIALENAVKAENNKNTISSPST
tara:strand:- start:26 stop:904 length:879 start_codon:yes stop_codon:yes gene_type:complete